MNYKNYLLGLLAFATMHPLFAQAQLDTSTSRDSVFSRSLMEGINTSYPDVRPLISADGNTLYFSRRLKSGTAKREGNDDIYVTRKDPASGSWGEAERLPKKLNNRRSNAVASIKPDGEELILFNTYKNMDNVPLVRTIKEDGSWKSPEEITIQGFQNFSSYVDFFMDYEQEVLLMAIQPNRSNTEQDLLVAFPDGKNGWKKPKSMGPVLNTPKSDFAPFMGADGKTLLFSSYGHSSTGGSDIFMSVRLDDTWENWSEPVNLGTDINTRDDENYFSIDKNFENLYYTSQKDGADHWKVFRVKLPEDFTAINGPVLAQLNSNEIRKIMDSGNYWISPDGRKTNDEGIAFEGWPKDPEPEAPMEEPVVAEAEDTSIPARLRGFRPADEVNTLSTEAAGIRDYLRQEMPETAISVRLKDDTTEFKLVEDILFDFNSIQASGDYQQRLNSIARMLKNNEELKVQLIGHTDSIGSAAVNEKIARLRVKSISETLTKNGINSNRIEVIAAGLAEPIAPNETDEGRNRNRRVETIIRFSGN